MNRHRQKECIRQRLAKHRSSAAEPKINLLTQISSITLNDRNVNPTSDALTDGEQGAKRTIPNNDIRWKMRGYVSRWMLERRDSLWYHRFYEDRIGCRCGRKGEVYSIFVYVNDGNPQPWLDGEYCRQLPDHIFAQDSTVLVMCLDLETCTDADGEVEYRLHEYGGIKYNPEIWRLNKLGDKMIFEYYPSKEMAEQVWQLMYAFNSGEDERYDRLFGEIPPAVEGVVAYSSDSRGDTIVYLRTICHQYGRMKKGYVRYNDVVYNCVPYIEGLGFFSWESDRVTGHINKLVCHPFDGGERKVVEFVKTGEDAFSLVPQITRAEPLIPVELERFALKLYFDNGQCRKYILPIKGDGKQEMISYAGYDFTDAIWASAVLADASKDSGRYLETCPAIVFSNGFRLEGTRCWIDSEFYSEPTVLNEVVYSDERYYVKKLWKWHAAKVDSCGAGLMEGVISYLDPIWEDRSTSVITLDGRRKTTQTFNWQGRFVENRAKVKRNGYGWGFVNGDMNVVIPLKYDEAGDFENGQAKVKLNNEWLYVSKHQGEKLIGANAVNRKYQEFGKYSEGRCRAATLVLYGSDLAYSGNDRMTAGIWSYLDETGDEVIAPQYIYAGDFENGIAIVAKGEWKREPKWKGKYWRKEERWGAIDRNGDEVIPFRFDEIVRFDRSDIFGARQNGRWGVIDRNGLWVAEPIFGEIHNCSQDDLISFSERNSRRDEDHKTWEDCDETELIGIYDIKQKKVILKPQFRSVSFYEDGRIEVRMYDEQLGRAATKIIDHTGREMFESPYTYIRPNVRTKGGYSEVAIEDENGESKYGVIDKNGAVILPCNFDRPWLCDLYQKNVMVYEENGKYGTTDRDENILTPAVFHNVWYCIFDDLIEVSEDDPYNQYNKAGCLTFEGNLVIPMKYDQIRRVYNSRYYCCRAEGCYEMYEITRKRGKNTEE